MPGPLRPPKGKRASAREKAQARSRTGPSPEPKREGGLLHLEKEDRSGYLREAFELSTLWAVELAERHKKERATLSEEHRNKLGAELQKERNRIAAERDALKQKQKDEAKDLTKRHLGERAKEAEDKREGRDKKGFQEDMRRKRRRHSTYQRRVERAPNSLADKFRRAKARGSGRPGPAIDDRKRKAQSDIADEFNRTRGDKERPASKERPDTHEPFFKGNNSFKDNAEDLSHDQGRERSRKENRQGANRNNSTPLVLSFVCGLFGLRSPLPARRFRRNLFDSNFSVSRGRNRRATMFINLLISISSGRTVIICSSDGSSSSSRRVSTLPLILSTMLSTVRALPVCRIDYARPASARRGPCEHLPPKKDLAVQAYPRLSVSARRAGNPRT